MSVTYGCLRPPTAKLNSCCEKNHLAYKAKKHLLGGFSKEKFPEDCRATRKMEIGPQKRLP
jgi:hypothetical protein